MNTTAQANHTGHAPPELVMFGATTLSTLIRERRVSCREVMAAYLDHIEAVNPHVNAIVSLQDRGDLLAQADNRDAELAQGDYRGWLHGIPQAIKDLAATAGIRTTWGSPLFHDHVPDTDAIVAERMKRDGAIVIGKTNTPEFGLGSQTYNPVFGATRNAFDPTKTAGGSSGGAAAALAMRMLPVADGSDMMGSLRNPGAFNNVFGFRPSSGRVPSGPCGSIFGQQLGTAGPMGRSVTDVAQLLTTQAGADPSVPLSLDADPTIFTQDLRRDLTGTRIGWLGDWQGHLTMEPGVLDLCEQALTTFEAIGCDVTPVVPDFSPERLWDTWLTLRHWVVAGNLAPLYRDPNQRTQLKPEAQWEYEGSLAYSAADIFDASTACSEWFQSLRRLFTHCDYLVLPTAQVFPFDVSTHWPDAIDGVAMDTYHRWMEAVVPGTLSGCPTMNVPAGFNTAGLPMGLQIIGPHHADLAVLQLAHAWEQASADTLATLPPVLAPA